MEHKWKISSVEIMGRAVLAPLSGVTDVAFRRIARRFGAALVVSEMVASEDLVRGASEAQIRAEGQGIFPHMVQIAGCDPYWMGEAAQVAEASGADIIDINMGCPAKRVTGGYSGSALMRDLELATRIIEATVSACSIPVTVKMRLGWDETTLNASLLAQRATDIGVSAVTVHGRTRQQFYKGKADWKAISEVSQNIDIPLIANGDIEDPAGAAKCLADAKATAVMVGRAAVGRPWLVGHICASLKGENPEFPPSGKRVEAAIEHYETLLSTLGKETGIRHARKHLAAYADVACEEGYAFSETGRRELVTSENPQRVLALIEQIYAFPNRKAA